MSDEDSTTTINDIADSGTFNINYTDCNFIDNNNNLNEQDLLKYGNNNLKIMNRRKQIKPIRISNSEKEKLSTLNTANNSNSNNNDLIKSNHELNNENNLNNNDDQNKISSDINVNNNNNNLYGVLKRKQNDINSSNSSDKRIKLNHDNSSNNIASDDEDEDDDNSSLSENSSNQDYDEIDRKNLDNIKSDIKASELENSSLTAIKKDDLTIASSTPTTATTLSQQAPATTIKMSYHNMDTFCTICKKELCNKYFLKTHLANKHGIIQNDDLTTVASVSIINSNSNSNSNQTLQMSSVKSNKKPIDTSDNERESDEQQQRQQDEQNKLDYLLLNENSNDDDNELTSKQSLSNQIEDFCEICQKQFCNKYYLKKHKYDVHGVLIENGIKSYKRVPSEVTLSNSIVPVTTTTATTTVTVTSTSTNSNTNLRNVSSPLDGVSSNNNNSNASKAIINPIQMLMNPFLTPFLNNPLITPEVAAAAVAAATASAYGHLQPENGVLQTHVNPLDIEQAAALTASNILLNLNNQMNESDPLAMGLKHDSLLTSTLNAFTTTTNNSLLTTTLTTAPSLDATTTSTSASVIAPAITNILNDKNNKKLKNTSLTTIKKNEFKCDLCTKQFQNEEYLALHRFNRHNIPLNLNEFTSSSQSISSSTNNCFESNALANQVAINNLNNLRNNNLKSIKNEIIQQFQQQQQLQEVTAQQNKIISNEKENFDDISNSIKNRNLLVNALYGTEIMKDNKNQASSSSSSTSAISNTTGSKLLNSDLLNTTNLLSTGNTGETYCEYCSKSFCNKYYLLTHMIRTHGKMLNETTKRDFELDDNEFLISQQQQLKNLQQNENKDLDIISPKPEPHDNTGELLYDANSNTSNQFNLNGMIDTNFAAKIADRVICDICNKQVCNKYFLRTHKQKVHGINTVDYAPSSSSSLNIKQIENANLSLNEANNDDESRSTSEMSLKLDTDTNGHNGGNIKIDIDDEAGELEHDISEISNKSKDYNHFRRVSNAASANSLSPNNITINNNIQNSKSSNINEIALQQSQSQQIISRDSYCDLCKRQFCSKYFLRQHLINMHGINQSKLSYNSNKTINSHNNHHQQQQQPPCSKQSHNNLNEKENEVNFKKQKLDATSAATLNQSKSNNNNANTRVNTSSASSISSKSSTYNYNLNNSNIGLNGHGTSRVTCAICNKELCNKYFLRQHLINVHKMSIEEYIEKYDLANKMKKFDDSNNNSDYEDFNEQNLIDNSSANNRINNNKSLNNTDEEKNSQKLLNKKINLHKFKKHKLKILSLRDFKLSHKSRSRKYSENSSASISSSADSSSSTSSLMSLRALSPSNSSSVSSAVSSTKSDTVIGKTKLSSSKNLFNGASASFLKRLSSNPVVLVDKNGNFVKEKYFSKKLKYHHQLTHHQNNNENESIDVQPFLIESKDDAFCNNFMPCMIYLPVKYKLNESISLNLTLKPIRKREDNSSNKTSNIKTENEYVENNKTSNNEGDMLNGIKTGQMQVELLDRN